MGRALRRGIRGLSNRWIQWTALGVTGQRLRAQGQESKSRDGDATPARLDEEKPWSGRCTAAGGEDEDDGMRSASSILV